MKVGDSLEYSPGARLNTYGYIMDVEVFLGDAFRFVVYDKDLNKFSVQRNLVKPEDVGDYPIQVTAKFFNATF